MTHTTPSADRPVSEHMAVNLLWCVPGAVGGSEQYLARQLVGLADGTDDFAPTLYCPDGFVEAHPELDERFEMVTASINGSDRTRRVFTEHTWLARRTAGASLVHHGGGTAPAFGGGPVVLTIHDLQYETYPDYLHPIKLRYLRSVMPRSVSRASVIAVPTQYVRSTVIDRFDVDPDQVVVVRHGVEPDLGTRAGEADELRDRFGLGAGPVLVLPAVTHRHKGHRFLLEVMAEHWTDPDLRLVLLGGVGAAEAEIAAAVETLGLADRVVRTGRVGDADRDGLVRLADALVFPSEYEGFGAPVVEAMALGTPVICSDQPALGEVVGDAGVVLPLVRDAWSDALAVVERRRDRLVADGHRRALDFTSVSSGSDLAAAYRLALATGR